MMQGASLTSFPASVLLKIQMKPLIIRTKLLFIKTKVSFTKTKASFIGTTKDKEHKLE